MESSIKFWKQYANNILLKVKLWAGIDAEHLMAQDPTKIPTCIKPDIEVREPDIEEEIVNFVLF